MSGPSKSFKLLATERVSEIAEQHWEVAKEELKNRPMPDVMWDLCCGYTGGLHEVFCKTIFACAIKDMAATATDLYREVHRGY